MIALIVLGHLQQPAFEFSVDPQHGLSIVAAGIPVVRGSWFQYYAPGWTKGYFSSRWTKQTVKIVDADTITMAFRSGPAFGNANYKRVGNRLNVVFELNWESDEPALLEFTAGMSWLTPFMNGEAVLDGRTRNLPTLPPVGQIPQRQLGAESLRTELLGTALKLGIESELPMLSFDARGYSQDWAEALPLYWHGFGSVKLERSKPTRIGYSFIVSPRARPFAEPRKMSFIANELKGGQVAAAGRPVLIPKPSDDDLDWSRTLPITGYWNFPAGYPKLFGTFKQQLESRFTLPPLIPGSLRVDFDGGAGNLEKAPGSYRITITDKSISVIGQDFEGFETGLFRLAQLAFVQNGQLSLPTGTLTDVPAMSFRGVHLFVGPDAKSFQQKLWSRVLRPLGLNKVVLQCEQTAWKTLPGIEGAITMKQQDLVELFDWYRGQNVEPIPLIQSWGHMDWLFGNRKNLELAVDPGTPYAIDVSKPESQTLLSNLWAEAIKALKPKTIHFGLDEVDMRGFPKNPELVTSLWEKHLPFLGSIAAKHGVEMMLWGDKALAPGEAVDATHGDSADHALRRRAAIPKNAMISDWHYRADESQKTFLKSLQLWKSEGFRPIASSWFRPANISGFFRAAAVEHAGSLQTTWAGYESSSQNMVKQPQQFSAMVLAADYAWSGRGETVKQLQYRADDVFARMYSQRPLPVVASRVLTLGRGDTVSVGGVSFVQLFQTQLAGISSASFSAPTSITFEVSAAAKEFCMALKCESAESSGNEIAKLEFTFSDGKREVTPLVYGEHVSAESDAHLPVGGVTERGITCVRIPLRSVSLKSIRIYQAKPTVGLCVVGVTLLPN